MKTHPGTEHGALTARVLMAIALGSAALLIGFFSFAADPANGTLSPTNRTITYTGGPFLFPTNPTDSASGPVACDQTDPCDDFGLTVDIPQDYLDANPNDVLRITISWADPTGEQDLDAFLVNNPDDNNYPAHAGNGSTQPEVITVPISKLGAGTHQYFVRVVPFVSTGQAFTGTIELVGTPATPPPPPAYTGIAPRYYTYAPGPGIGENAGEPSIGYNLTTHRAMYLAGLQTLQVTFPEDVNATTPSACDATWTDVSNVVTKTRSLDPILYTDQRTGRTFVSQLDSLSQTASTGVLVGLNSFMAYSDDDGATWTPAQVNPPDGSYDHQTVGAGPYPASLPLGNDVNKGDAVYYCSQAGVTAFCSRSDDGGLNFGRAMPIYTSATDGCGGIHGHVKVAPDGTVYVPNRGCDNVQSVTVSEDAGTTWTVHHVAGTDIFGNQFAAKPPPGILDPSIGIASDGTLYFAYISGETDGGHAHVAVSHDKGATWTNDYDLGANQNLHNAVFIEAVAGDPDRAAVGFIGTTQPGDHEADTFNGTWYAFVATTYDGGQTWATVNAAPNAPVQRNAGIWNEGGTNPLRNLLDFNEITIDEKGRALYAFADGCINECETGGPNSFSSKATIARQSGGKGLLAQFDPVEPVVAQPACLSGRRDDMASYLHWVAPDNGGSAITSYKIYRSTGQSGSVTQIGFADAGKTSYVDRSGDPSVTDYVYQIVAVNAQGDGAPSNSVDLTVGPRLEATGACSLPGVEVVIDPQGDESDGISEHDVTSVSVAELMDDNVSGSASKVQFILKVVDLNTVLPGWRWSVRFNVTANGQPVTPPADAAGNAQDDFFVSMVSSDGAAPSFTYGTTGVPTVQNNAAPARVFTTIGNLDAASNYSADGTITLVLPKSIIGNPGPGDSININLASVRASGPSAIPETGGTNETIPDTTGIGVYQLRAANLCLPNTAPLASLAATPDQGTGPLTVTLDGSKSSDPDSIDTIASYTFNFGDGSDDVTQSSPTLTHTFIQPGLYPVKLVVTDSRGKVSSNTDQHLVNVSAPTGTPSVSVSVSPSQVSEGNTATFTITASRALTQAITVNYSMSGKATLGSDYTLSGTAGSVVIPAGQSSATVTLSAVKDNVKEKAETAVMTLQSGSGYNFGSSTTGKKAKKVKAPSATLTITD